MYFRPSNLYRSHFHTNSSLPLLEATIVKTRHASKTYTLLSSETSSRFKPLSCPKKKWLARGKCFIDQMQPMITEWTVLILEQKFPCKCLISPIRNITLAIHRKSLTRDLNTIIYSTLQLKDNIFETSLKFITILNTANITARWNCTFLKAMILFASPKVRKKKRTFQLCVYPAPSGI